MRYSLQRRWCSMIQSLYVQVMVTGSIWLELPVFLMFGIFFLCRWSYYGQLLPNTCYLKVGLPGTFDGWARGWRYLLAFLQSEFYLPLFSIVGGILIFRRESFLCIALILLHAVYVVYVGGDFYPFF